MSLLSPSSIAIIGASDDPNKIGGRPLLYLSRFGFKGPIYPINPSRDRVQKRKCYSTLDALPETPELAIIATPGTLVPDAVAACADRGVRTAVIMASGYAETADAAAIAAEGEMVRRARAAGMRLVGPNSQGLANFGTGAVASFSTMFLEVEPADGPVAIVSQSGMMSVVPYGLLRARGIGVRHSHATGNEADVTLPEVALEVLADPEVRLLLLYIESIRDAPALARAAALARERDVPLVAVKAGRTSRGQQAARSHTAALANDDRVVDAFFARHGIWRAADIHDLVRASELYLKGWRPRNRALVVLTNSGASGVMAADAAPAAGLELAPLSEATAAALAAHLPSFANVANPLDTTTALLADSSLFGRLLAALGADDRADQYLITLPVAGTGYDVPGFARDAAAFLERSGKALAVAAPQENVAAAFRAAGVPAFSNQTDAMAALAQLARHAAMMRERPAAGSPGPAVDVPEGRSRFLDEAQSLGWLGTHGLPIVKFRVCRTAHEARLALEEFGVVAMKACASAIPHKSEQGLVTLDVRGHRMAAATFAAIEQAMGRLGAEGAVLVSPMVTGGLELLLGARNDPQFGPVVVVGAGGKYAEALDDIRVLIPPLTDEDVRAAVLSLRIGPLFTGVRGEPALDLDALCAAAVQLGDLALASAGTVDSIDLNPVIVGVQGRGVTIVDALVERRQP